MKKLTVIFLALVLILALTACGEAKESGESVPEGTVTDVLSGAAGETEETHKLTAEETREIMSIMEQGSWHTGGTANCISDCKLTINGETYYYHSECGTLNDNPNNRCLTVTEAEKASINALLSRYITLGAE